MTDPTTLTVDLPLELRAVPDDEGVIEGRIVPYGEVVTVGGQQEAFAAGVFDGTDPADVVLLWQHDPTQPIGRAIELTDEADGAFARFRMANTDRAREAYALARDGIARGLSVGFQSLEATRDDGVRTHRRARLFETSLVTFPAYPTAGVLAVRNETEETMPETELEAAEVVFDLTPVETRLDGHDEAIREVRNHLANIVGDPAPVAPPMTLTAAYAELLRMVADRPADNRALADVIGTAPGNASGLIHNQWVAEVLGILNPNRPLFAAAGTVGFPSTGYGLQWPRITQHTAVAKRGAEKTEVPTRELTVDGVLFSMEWFAGAVDVSLELIAQSEPSVVEVVVGDLLDQYAIATETEFSVDAVAAATVGGAALPVTDWSDFVAAVVATSSDIRAATGLPGNLLALTEASWLGLLGLLNPSQPSVSFGNGPDFTAESVTFGGIVAFHAPYITADLQFNQKSLRKSERAPDQVTANNVALMGRDIGILGATIALPLYPAGIVKHAVAGP